MDEYGYTGLDQRLDREEDAEMHNDDGTLAPGDGTPDDEFGYAYL